MDSIQQLITELNSMARSLDSAITEVAGVEAQWRAQHPEDGIGTHIDYTISGGDLLALSEVRENLNSLLMEFEETRYVLQPENPED